MTDIEFKEDFLAGIWTEWDSKISLAQNMTALSKHPVITRRGITGVTTYITAWMLQTHRSAPSLFTRLAFPF